MLFNLIRCLVHGKHTNQKKLAFEHLLHIMAFSTRKVSYLVLCFLGFLFHTQPILSVHQTSAPSTRSRSELKFIHLDGPVSESVTTAVLQALLPTILYLESGPSLLTGSARSTLVLTACSPVLLVILSGKRLMVHTPF